MCGVGSASCLPAQDVRNVPTRAAVAALASKLDTLACPVLFALSLSS